MFLRFFRGRATVRPSEFASILSVHESHKPGLLSGSLSGDRWRHESMGKTLNVITDHRKAEELKRQALTNLSSWTKTRSTPPSEVEVVYKDWGCRIRGNEKICKNLLHFKHGQFTIPWRRRIGRRKCPGRKHVA